MEQKKYIIRYIEKISRCHCRSFDLTGKTVLVSDAEIYSKDPVCLCPELFSGLSECASKGQCTIFNDNAAIYGVFKHENLIYIQGPSSSIPLNRSDVQKYLQSRNSDSSYFLPYMPIEDFIQILKFHYGLITGDFSDSVNPFLNYVNSQKLTEQIEGKFAMHQLSNSEDARPHMPFSKEQELLHGFAVDHPVPAEKTDYWMPGVIAKDAQKQYEYECVCEITLVSRNTILAGVPESRAYAISDLLLQKLSVARNIIEMKQIREYGGSLFVQEIKKAQKEMTDNVYIEKIKNYVAKHIFEKIRLDDIAKHVGLNSNYISGLFARKTGQPLSRYILRKKVELSCNLLKYSDSSIAVIAEYMGITPQSYFTKVFREITGTTPARYRQENTLDDFTQKQLE